MGDGCLPSAAPARPRIESWAGSASAKPACAASRRTRRWPPQTTLSVVGCVMFRLRLRYRSDSDKTSGPVATRGSSHSLPVLLQGGRDTEAQEVGFLFSERARATPRKFPQR